MERKLIANHLVPDNEVWVSPATWENPFSLNAKVDSTSANNRYATALDTIREMKESTGTIRVYLCDYELWLLERLNADDSTSHS